MNKQLKLDFSCIKDLRDDVKNQIKENIEKENYTLDQLNSIYRHIYVCTEKFKPLQKDQVMFISFTDVKILRYEKYLISKKMNKIQKCIKLVKVVQQM